MAGLTNDERCLIYNNACGEKLRFKNLKMFLNI